MVASSVASFMVNPKLGTAELLFSCAEKMGLTPIWLTADSVFSIEVDGQERYINLARSPLNSDASAALAKNKYVTRCILEKNHIPNIPFILPKTHAQATSFLKTYGTIVAKPVTGAGAMDIHIINEQAQLKTLRINHYILEKYITGKELRFLMLNGEVVGVHRSEYGTSVAKDRPLERISYPQSNWDPTLVKMSQRITDLLNLKFAAVDFLIDASGHAYTLEVNTMPGLKWFHAPSSGPIVDIARLFLESVVDALRREQQPNRSTLTNSSIRAYNELMGVMS